MTSPVRTVSVRLPSSPMTAIETFAAENGTGMSQFLARAAAEKLTALKSSESWFAERLGQGDLDAAIRFLRRPGTSAPLPEDAL